MTNVKSVLKSSAVKLTIYYLQGFSQTLALDSSYSMQLVCRVLLCRGCWLLQDRNHHKYTCNGKIDSKIQFLLSGCPPKKTVYCSFQKFINSKFNYTSYYQLLPSTTPKHKLYSSIRVTTLELVSWYYNWQKVVQ